jgi:hypothetical protein
MIAASPPSWRALAAGRGDVGQSRHALQGALDGLGDLLFDDLRGDARVGRDDERGRKLDRRDELLLGRRDGNGAEALDDDRDDRDKPPVRQTEPGENGHVLDLLSSAGS